MDYLIAKIIAEHAGVLFHITSCSALLANMMISV